MHFHELRLMSLGYTKGSFLEDGDTHDAEDVKRWRKMLKEGKRWRGRRRRWRPVTLTIYEGMWEFIMGLSWLHLLLLEQKLFFSCVHQPHARALWQLTYWRHVDGDDSSLPVSVSTCAPPAVASQNVLHGNGVVTFFYYETTGRWMKMTIYRLSLKGQSSVSG